MKIKETSEKLSKLLSNNTGYSIKNWFIWGTFIVGVLILLTTVLVMIWDVVHDGKVDSSIKDLSEVILAVSALFTAAGLPKIVGEIFEQRKNKQE